MINISKKSDSIKLLCKNLLYIVEFPLSVKKSEGHGLESQEHRCRDFADQKGYEVEKVFRDSFTGGGDFTKRPAMSEMLSYIDSKPYNRYVVIFDDLKRLARDVEQHLGLKKAFEMRKVRVECPNFAFSDSPEGQYVETIMAAGAQLEREQNRRQVLQKMKARLEIGCWCFPAVPQGYVYKKDPVYGMIPVIDQSKGTIIREALEGYASGRFLGQEDVRLFLQEKDLFGGKPVYLAYVKRILTNVFNAGYVEYAPWEVSRRLGKHEALIDLQTYEKIQERLSTKTTTHVKNFLNEDFPLRSFVVCNDCRQPMTASWSTGSSAKFAYYRCKTKNCNERNKSIPKKVIEKQFEEILGRIKPSSAMLILVKVIVADVWKKKEAQIIGQRSEIEKKDYST